MNIETIVDWLASGTLAIGILLGVLLFVGIWNVGSRVVDYLEATKPPTKNTGPRVFRHDQSGFSFMRLTREPDCTETIGIPYSAVKQVKSRMSIEPSSMTVRMPDGERIHMRDQVVVVTVEYADGTTKEFDRVIAT